MSIGTIVLSEPLLETHEGRLVYRCPLDRSPILGLAKAVLN